MGQWFEDKKQYTDDSPLGPLKEFSPDLIRVYPGIEKVQPGWGRKTYMDNRNKNAFSRRRALRFYENTSQPFAVVMRSIPVICVDIDGKNGGIETANTLQLPRTAAEISKSGNGYHLFYELLDQWDEKYGYQSMGDVNGLVPGIDIRGTGIVYHYPGQLWNQTTITPLPKSLFELVDRRSKLKYESRVTRSGASALDEDDLAILHDKLKTRLERTIPQGMRNNRLFEVGAKMYAAFYPNWQLELYDRGLEVGLDEKEIGGIIESIEKYAE